MADLTVRTTGTSVWPSFSGVADQYVRSAAALRTAAAQARGGSPRSCDALRVQPLGEMLVEPRIERGLDVRVLSGPVIRCAG